MKKFKLVSRFPVVEYKCGLKAGELLRLKRQIVLKDHTGKPTGETNEIGEIWTVLKGAKEEPRVLWLREPDGKSHTWDDNESVFDYFERAKE